MSYFRETGNYDRNRIKVKLDFSNYATKSDTKKATGVDRSEFSTKADLDYVDKLYNDDLEFVTTSLSKLKNIVDNHIVKKTIYNE